MTKRILTLTLFALALPGITALSQENSTPTQALVAFNSSNPVSPTPKDIALKIDGRSTNLLNLARVPPNGAQVALLIDDGLRSSIGGDLNSLRSFITSLPKGTEVFVGFMQNGRVSPPATYPASPPTTPPLQRPSVFPWASEAPTPAPISASPNSSRIGPLLF